jgi:hypothetical protein
MSEAMGDRELVVAAGRPALSRKQRDFLLLNIFVLMRHGYVERARILADALNAIGDDSAEVHLARAVLRFAESKWGEALESLEVLDRIDPLERFGSYRLTDKQRMRRYLKTRCLHELGDHARVRDAIEAYMRHGEMGSEEPE